MFRTASIIAFASALAAPAFADTSPNFTFSFVYDPAALSSAQGATEVYKDLQLEASNACRKGPPSAQRIVDPKCRDGLIEAAVRQANNPLLIRIHSGGPQFAQN